MPSRSRCCEEASADDSTDYLQELADDFLSSVPMELCETAATLPACSFPEAPSYLSTDSFDQLCFSPVADCTVAGSSWGLNTLNDAMPFSHSHSPADTPTKAQPDVQSACEGSSSSDASQPMPSLMRQDVLGLSSADCRLATEAAVPVLADFQPESMGRSADIGQS